MRKPARLIALAFVIAPLLMGRTLPQTAYATELALRFYRLATVRGIVNG